MSAFATDLDFLFKTYLDKGSIKEEEIKRFKEQIEFGKKGR